MTLDSNIDTKLSFSNFLHLQQYSKLLRYIWPIGIAELPKFFTITLLMFCILWIQNLVRALKDSIVSTMIGPETISFLKFWGVMPAAFIITIIYVKLLHTVKSENIFYIIVSSFLLFFAIFAFYLFPNYQFLHLNSVDMQSMIVQYPHFRWFILLLSNWSFSLFYIIAELWHNVVLALLFWQFVNIITNVEESRRFYPLFGLFAQTGLYFSGEFLMNLTSFNKYFSESFSINLSDDILSVQVILSTVILSGVIALITFWFINRNILQTEQVALLRFNINKPKISLLESVKMIISSRYIMLIALLLICYGMAINLVEGPWKAAASKIYTTPKDFAMFVGNYLRYTGIATISFVILCSGLVRFFGWFTAAIITPLIIFSTGILFFIVDNFDFAMEFAIASFATIDPALLAVTIGAIQNVFSKSSKYTLFDATKEMAYVPLDAELKTKGKAAADIIGTKLGKSASAFIQFAIFTIIPSASYQSISMYLMVIFTIICVIWIIVVNNLNKEYMSLI